MLSPNESEFTEFLKMAIQTQSEYKNHIKQSLKDQEIDLSYENFQILVILWQKDGVNQQELADHLHKDKATLTYLLDGLTQRKLIKRTEDSNDRRSKLITLTEKGHETKDKILPLVNDLFMKACKGITSEELKNALCLYEKICKNLQE